MKTKRPNDIFKSQSTSKVEQRLRPLGIFHSPFSVFPALSALESYLESPRTTKRHDHHMHARV